ncbi:MAG TPA: hypothetical protein VN541_02325 [Tepidisphaeraceae bacterium]|nr:hypothetical protein [Tepidisphaeraceae bacterium]
MEGGFVVECRVRVPNEAFREQYVSVKVGQRVYDTDWILDRVVRYDRPGAGVGLVVAMRRDKSDDVFVYQFTHCVPPTVALTAPAEGPIIEPRIDPPDDPLPPKALPPGFVSRRPHRATTTP